MDMTTFLIMVAPPLLLVACVVLVFVWATFAKEPAFVREAQEQAELQEDTNEASSS
ncbi:cytochrome bd oxidase small subunit CydS [Evansella cellulosilytica]|uniref:Uncharacterized protein n=1 Tax=Evansella cellulosilytica (strain ATCC 21833 / DSM 2522 / FERM P-1141 / JCM 9156 / N-4) TaxID=649639 RepID=E6TU81_EVAC2|nr:hypothetical protein [Evansella cellulosilytica]ADU28541.1 hypothetical protein Bcell_0254 [Evansella cellulosilytica DSM 2522]